MITHIVNTTRIVFTAAAMPADQARAIVELICASSPERAAEQRRNRIERRMTNAVQRVLKFAKHETLRKLHRYKYSHRPLMGQEEQALHPDSIKIAFNIDELRNDLLTMLETEGASALSTAAQDTLDSVGYRDPWKLPAQDTLDFIAGRQNLLSNVPQEIFDTIRDEISTGLNKGESSRELSKRINNAFDEIGKGRAEVIAQTETAAAFGFASDKAARQAGIQYKKWLHSVISKVPRPDHMAIDGLIVPMDEPYPVGDPPLMYPHAPDGAAEDVINCRCLSIPVTEAEYQSQQIKGGYDPNEPRVPAGSPEGGEWTDEGGQSEITQTESDIIPSVPSGKTPVVTIEKTQKSAQAFGRGPDAYRQSAKYDVKINGTVRGRIWADKAGYMQKPFWNIAKINPDGSNIRTIHLATSYDTAVKWAQTNHQKFIEK